MKSSPALGFNGAFFIPLQSDPKIVFKVIVSDGSGWDHVSVSLPNRCPTWPELCWIKDLFWPEDQTVVQYHPAKSEYVNNMKYCLHLWRYQAMQFPVPPSYMIGDKQLGTIG
jgi:hypothetical protein